MSLQCRFYLVSSNRQTFVIDTFEWCTWGLQSNQKVEKIKQHLVSILLLSQGCQPFCPKVYTYISWLCGCFNHASTAHRTFTVNTASSTRRCTRSRPEGSNHQELELKTPWKQSHRLNVNSEFPKRCRFKQWHQFSELQSKAGLLAGLLRLETWAASASSLKEWVGSHENAGESSSFWTHIFLPCLEREPQGDTFLISAP